MAFEAASHTFSIVEKANGLTVIRQKYSLHINLLRDLQSRGVASKFDPVSARRHYRSKIIVARPPLHPESVCLL